MGQVSRIRNATIADAERIARLVGELGYPTSTTQMQQRLESILRDDGYDTLVACDDEDVVGFIGTRVGLPYERDECCGQIMALAVAADHQRHGVGTGAVCRPPNCPSFNAAREYWS